MVRHPRRLAGLTLLCDLVALIIAFEGSGWLRVLLNPLFEAQMDEAQLLVLTPPLGLVLLLWIPASLWLRLYQARRGPRIFAAVLPVAEAMLLVMVLTIVVTFFVRDFGTNFSRSFLIFLATVGIAALLAGRALVGLGTWIAGRGGQGRERVLIVGQGRGAKALIARLEKTAARAVALVGVVTPAGRKADGVLGNPVPIVGTLPDLAALINRLRIDRVVAVEKEVPPDEFYGCVSVCTRMGVPVGHTAGALQAPFAQVGVAQIGDVSLMEVRGLEFTRAQEFAKRAFDLTVSAVTLVVLAPLLAAIALAIKLGSAGPVLYVAPRVGRGGRHFPFFKFRTMVADAEARRAALAPRNEQHGHLFKIGADPRVTAFGRLLRRYSLDELPQLLNVLRGEMSLVGPRPLPAGDLEPDGLSHEYRFWAKERSRVLPGITGLWQVRGRADLSFEEMLRLDVAYVRRWSLFLDLRVLFMTVPAVLRRRGAC
jgi:exopolysaccharide biosynthesis polyprenyl glycosylphosphotransferase